MREILITLLFFACAEAFAQDTISTKVITNFVGKDKFVKGKVVGVRKSTETNLITLNIDAAFPNNIFSVVVSEKMLTRLKIDFNKLKDKNIVVKGLIVNGKESGGLPSIINPQKFAIVK